MFITEFTNLIFCLLTKYKFGRAVENEIIHSKKYSYYKFNSETKVNSCNPKLNVFDLGTKPIYYRKDFDTLVHIKIDKVITDYLRFIHSIK